MRVLVYFGQILLIAAVGAAAVMVWGMVLSRGGQGGGPAPLVADAGRSGGAQSGAAPSGLEMLADRLGLAPRRAPGDPLARVHFALTEVAETGPGRTRHGVTLLQHGQGAAIGFPDGGQVLLRAPDGTRLDPEVFALDARVAGFRLLPEGGDALPALVTRAPGYEQVVLIEKLAFYDATARRMLEEGRLGPGAPVAVTDASSDARGLILCTMLEGSELLAGAKLERGVVVVAFLRAGCGEAGPDDHARLALAAAAVRPTLP